MSNDYSVFTSELENFADPKRSDLFSVTFYDTAGYTYRYAELDSKNFYPVKCGLPKQTNVLAKRWYFGTYRRDVINSDRGGEINMDFALRCDSARNLKLFQFLGVPVGDRFLDDRRRYKHPEFNRRFDKIEIVTRNSAFNGGDVYTLYNCNVSDLSSSDLDARTSDQVYLSVTIAYDTFDVREAASDE